MKVRLQVTVEGQGTREVSGEISGKLSEREEQLKQLFAEAQCQALEDSLRGDQPVVERPICCGGPTKKVRFRSRQLVTPVGVVTWDRQVYSCPRCGRSVVPLDDLLSIPRGAISPGLGKVSLDFVQVESYEQSIEQVRRQHGVSLTHRTLVDLAWRLGPVAKRFEEGVEAEAWRSEPIQRLYVGCDGVMVCTNGLDEQGQLIWREVKVGCCFWYDGKGRLHKWLLGRMESAEAFGPRLRGWAERCGLSKAREVVFLGDGAEWVWNIAAAYFNDDRMTWVLDWYHLMEHVWEAARRLWPEDTRRQGKEVVRWQGILRQEGGRSLRRVLSRKQKGLAQGSAEYGALDDLLRYLTPRLDQTDYPTYRNRQMCIGSGAVESAGKQLVVQRAKGPGMHWTPEGVQAVLSLRAISLNGDWDRFWSTEPLRQPA